MGPVHSEGAPPVLPKEVGNQAGVDPLEGAPRRLVVPMPRPGTEHDHLNKAGVSSRELRSRAILRRLRLQSRLFLSRLRSRLLLLHAWVSWGRIRPAVVVLINFT